jgi:hypothetical protein
LPAQRELQFIVGSGGPIVVTASPPIANGSVIGQELYLRGSDNTNTVYLTDDRTQLFLNGDWVGQQFSSLYLIWDGTGWWEIARNDI